MVRGKNRENNADEFEDNSSRSETKVFSNSRKHQGGEEMNLMSGLNRNIMVIATTIQD